MGAGEDGTFYACGLFSTFFQITLSRGDCAHYYLKTHVNVCTAKPTCICRPTQRHMVRTKQSFPPHPYPSQRAVLLSREAVAKATVASHGTTSSVSKLKSLQQYRTPDTTYLK